MPTFRRLAGPPAELPIDADRMAVPCSDKTTCYVHRSTVFRAGSWTVRQRNIFEVYWQKIQHFKFEYLGGIHVLGECDHDTFVALVEILGIRGLHWDQGTAYYIDA
ncbi:hypothetical protein BKA62DRAFT_769591 [Auriculariales sp. MPI-PUGE-AT-0066]|nr:hypothetical protein BKA62DRAFT_769591 [Auriculariales sp. MPI-PUGE-AT-0066]